MSTTVLVLKPSSFGDIIHTLPAVAWIKEARPDWKIAWLVNTEWAPLLAGNTTVDEVILFPRRTFRGVSGLGRFWKWTMTEVRGRNPETALDFQGLLRTAMIAKASGARALYGLSDAREGAGWFYQRQADVSEGSLHAVERYLRLARLSLAAGENTRPGRLSFPLPPGNLPESLGDHPGSGSILLHPFSRGRGKSLGWKQVLSLCEHLGLERRVILVGRSEGKEPALPRGCTSYLNRTSLEELIGFTRRAAFVVSVDSGPMHLAAALDRPLLSIHTWSDPRLVGPYRADAWVWKNGELFQFAQRHDFESSFYRSPVPVLRDLDLNRIAALALQSSAAS